MNSGELVVLAAGLSMDAFAVSICKGLSVRRAGLRHSLLCGAWFGAFQALMPLAGWLLGVRFQERIVRVDHWIAFLLLGVIGLEMIRDSREEAEVPDASFAPGAMLPLAVATSIDALAVGVTFACLQTAILPAVGLIGVVTFVLSAAGVQVGAVFGTRFRGRAELAGGLVLMGMGLKILMEHLGIWTL